MRGKKAASAQNRRANEAEAALAALRAQLAQERADHRAEVLRLESEVRTLRTDASRIAAQEVQRTLERIEDERKARGFSDQIAGDLLYQKDKFVMNACRYISMTKGEEPRFALDTVMTWMTGEDYYGPMSSVDLLIKCGLPHDGWVARTLKLEQHLRRRRAKIRKAEGRPYAVSLDRAEQDGHPDIHPDYKPSWYPGIEYQGIELLDEASDEATR